VNITFDQIVETIREFPDAQQEILLDLIQGWRIENRRLEIARDARHSLELYRAGLLQPRPAEAVIAALRDLPDDDE
jgi:hypothetical protein